MDYPNIIRVFIFLIAGLVVLIFPNHIYRFQTWALGKLKIKHKESKKVNQITGIIFLFISLALFVWAMKMV